MKAKLGMSPIAWWNDDLKELSDDVSLEECLRQSRSAGFTGMEKGRRFPDDPEVMLPILEAADVTLCGGWFSGTLANEEMAANKDRIAPMIALFKAVDAPCIVYGEVGRSIQGDRSKPLSTKPVLSDAEMKAYAGRCSRNSARGARKRACRWSITITWARWCSPRRSSMRSWRRRARAFRCCSMRGTWHLRAATCCARSISIMRGSSTCMSRTSGEPVIDALDWTKQSFLDAVALGAFTVPGDGSLDFGPIVRRLADHGYEGWFVVEAEQDPKKAPPLKMAQIGHKELMRVMTAAGYTVETQGFPG